jgi:hypothetical protein
MKQVVIALAMLVAFARLDLAEAQIFIQKTDQLVAEADPIFIGGVTLKQSRKPPGDLLVTDVVFSDTQVLQGAPADQVVLVGGAMPILAGQDVDVTLETRAHTTPP